jgi:hypothetical protein
MKKRLAAALGAMALLGAIAPALAVSPASAAATVEIKSAADTHCVDEIANSSHTIELTSCQRAANEEWTEAAVGGGLARFQNSSNGASLAQSWSVGGGLIQNADDGQCLTQSGFQVIFTQCLKNSDQIWELTP